MLQHLQTFAKTPIPKLSHWRWSIAFQRIATHHKDLLYTLGGLVLLVGLRNWRALGRIWGQSANFVSFLSRKSDIPRCFCLVFRGHPRPSHREASATKADRKPTYRSLLRIQSYQVMLVAESHESHTYSIIMNHHNWQIEGFCLFSVTGKMQTFLSTCCEKQLAGHYIIVFGDEVASGPFFALVSHGSVASPSTADEWEGGGPWSHALHHRPGVQEAAGRMASLWWRTHSENEHSGFDCRGWEVVWEL